MPARDLPLSTHTKANVTPSISLVEDASMKLGSMERPLPEGGSLGGPLDESLKAR